MRNNTITKNYYFIILFFYFLLMPSFAYADAGVPMIFLTFPGMLISLVPIIFIEAAIHKSLLQIKYKNAVLPSFISNLTSTIVGIPISWALLFGIELLTTGGGGHGIETIFKKIVAVTLQAAWLIPYESELYWMVPIAAMVGLIPAYFISIFIEYRIVKKYFMLIDKTKIKQAVWKANTVTYIILFILLAIYLLFSVIKR